VNAVVEAAVRICHVCMFVCIIRHGADLSLRKGKRTKAVQNMHAGSGVFRGGALGDTHLLGPQTCLPSL